MKLLICATPILYPKSNFMVDTVEIKKCGTGSFYEHTVAQIFVLNK